MSLKILADNWKTFLEEHLIYYRKIKISYHNVIKVNE